MMPMRSVRDVLAVLDDLAPPELAFEWDRVGLQLGSLDSIVESAVVTLDWSSDLVRFAEGHRAQLVVAHHPLIWEPIAALTDETPAGRCALRLAAQGVAFVACHTNWDCATGGINDTLASALGLHDIDSFGDSATPPDQFKLVTFCPESQTDAIIDALASAGAGRIGHYSRCCFVSHGTGSFVGDATSEPTVGQPGRPETLAEVRIEMLVPVNRVEDVVAALKSAHPYEEPAFDLLRLRRAKMQPIGRIGALPDSMGLTELVTLTDTALSTRCWAWGDPTARVSRISVVGGAGGSLWRSAMHAGADALIAGEVKQSDAVDAQVEGFPVIAAGHYATEMPGMRALTERLRLQIPDVSWHAYEPSAGRSGRPL